MEKKALGRGLTALIPENKIFEGERIVYLKTDEIKSSKYQPREEFDSGKQQELISSIKEKGVVQPIIVRPCATGGYELIAGERRLRAVKDLSIEKIPTIVKEAADVDALELALIENIQREDLNSIEEAHAYQRLMDEFEFTQEKVAQAVGKDRATVANILRLLNLPEKIQKFISKGLLTAGHAKVLLSVEDKTSQSILCDKIIKKGLSVREAENLIKIKTRHKIKTQAQKDLNLLEIEDQLSKALGTKVSVKCRKNRGSIQIDFYSLDDFDRIVNRLKNN